MSDNNFSPLTFKLPLWYGFGLSIIFLLYGGVKIVLSFLDKNFTEVNQLIIFLIYGIIILLFTIGLKKHKNWGKYGLVVTNAFLIIFSMIGNSSLETELMMINIFVALLTAGIIYCLFAPQTTKYLSQHS